MYGVGYADTMEKLGLSIGFVRQKLLQRMAKMPKVFQSGAAEEAAQALAQNYPRTVAASRFNAPRDLGLGRAGRMITNPDIPAHELPAIWEDLPKMLPQSARRGSVGGRAYDLWTNLEML